MWSAGFVWKWPPKWPFWMGIFGWQTIGLPPEEVTNWRLGHAKIGILTLQAVPTPIHQLPGRGWVVLNPEAHWHHMMFLFLYRSVHVSSTVSSSCSYVFLDSCSESLKFVATNYLFKPTHMKILQVWLNLDPVFATNTGRSFSVGLSDTGVSTSLNSKTWQKRLIDSDWPVDLEDLSGNSPWKICRCRVLLGKSEIFQPSMFDYRRVSWLIRCTDEFWLWLPSPSRFVGWFFEYPMGWIRIPDKSHWNIWNPTINPSINPISYWYPMTYGIL